IAPAGVGLRADGFLAVVVVERVVGRLQAADGDARERFLRVAVADHADDRLARRGRVPEAGRVVGGDRARWAVRPGLPLGQLEGLARPGRDGELLGGDVGPIELDGDEPVATEAGEPELARGVRRDLVEGDEKAREVVALEPAAPPLLALRRRQPLAEVLPV